MGALGTGGGLPSLSRCHLTTDVEPVRALDAWLPGEDRRAGGGGQRGGSCSGTSWRCWRLGRGRIVGRDRLSLSWALEVGREFDFYSAGNREPLQGFEKNSDMSGLRLTQDDSARSLGSRTEGGAC